MTPSTFSYNLLKFSLQMFQRPPHELEPGAYDTAQNQAREECALQKKYWKARKD